MRRPVRIRQSGDPVDNLPATIRDQSLSEIVFTFRNKVNDSAHLKNTFRETSKTTKNRVFREQSFLVEMYDPVGVLKWNYCSFMMFRDWKIDINYPTCSALTPSSRQYCSARALKSAPVLDLILLISKDSRRKILRVCIRNDDFAYQRIRAKVNHCVSDNLK